MQKEMKKQIEFLVIDDEELPPIIIKKNEDDMPKVMINAYHRLWISINRGLIAGIFEALPPKITDILDAYLREQYSWETVDRGD
tara:strand:- start:167 stop:418 length:252 start_codon:yes stop_codon:yes gene_type:complete